MASYQQVRRRSSVADQTTADLPLDAFNSISDKFPTASRDLSRRQEAIPDMIRGLRDSAMPMSMPPPPPREARDADRPPFRRHSRSKSSVCRQINRLSLTLPIAPPTSDPSRPTPTSAAMSSVPPTPVDSATASPSDANEFIIAIAAQERRVLELREELVRAEAQLSSLKKMFTAHESQKNQKKSERRSVEPTGRPVPGPDDDTASVRRSVDFDRRRLLQQQSQPSTPTGRRRILRGGHTRTLSLLSPVKPDAAFSLHEDGQEEPTQLPSLERRTAQLTNPNLAKRASWQPRSQQNPAGVPSLVEDFRLGLKAFVEDIRQITVGDEPINGQSTRSTSIDYRNPANPGNRSSSANQDTIKASQSSRPKASTLFESPTSSPTKASPRSAASPASKTEDATKTKTKAKHFSWTPLSFDSMDDSDWSNWDSPMSVKTTRWSGSTMGTDMDGMEELPEEGGQNMTPSKSKSTSSTDSPLRSPKLEEILPNMVNRLTPSNIKRTATNLMDEWEKSLSEPQNARFQNKENTV